MELKFNLEIKVLFTLWLGVIVDHSILVYSILVNLFCIIILLSLLYFCDIFGVECVHYIKLFCYILLISYL